MLDSIQIFVRRELSRTVLRNRLAILTGNFYLYIFIVSLPVVGMIDSCIEKIMASAKKKFNVRSSKLHSLRIVRVSLRRSPWREISVLGKNEHLYLNQLKRRV